MSAEPIRILVADDHALFREGVRALLAAIPGIEVVGEAATGEQAIENAARLQPDVVLMDINLPGVNGIEATRRILRTSPHIGVVVVTMVEDGSAIFAAMRAGARGYVLKGAHHEEVVQVIRAVAGGTALLGPDTAARLSNYFRELSDLPTASIPLLTLPELTDREREVLDLIAQGLKNAEIAERLVLSPKTVRNHITNIFSKLQVADRAEAILRARGAGLG